MSKRLAAALAAYAALIATAVYLLHGKVFYFAVGSYVMRGQILYGVLIIFAGLIAKTLIADKAGWTFHHGTQRSESESEVNQADSSSSLQTSRN